MTLADIMTLASAGFTKDDIMKLASIQAPAPAPDPAPAPAPAPDPAPDPAQAPAPAPAPDHSAEFAEILAAIRGANIAGIGGGTPAIPSADDVIASIISPAPPETNKGG